MSTISKKENISIFNDYINNDILAALKESDLKLS